MTTWFRRLSPRNPKLRPLVLLDATAHIAQWNDLTTVAITGEFTLAIEPDEVLFPWHSAGHAKSSSGKPSLAKCGWQPIIDKSSIVKIKGFVPRPQSQKIVGIVAIL